MPTRRFARQGAIGDDRLQKMATGRVMPDRFTHGTSAQRVEWFKRGMDTGDPERATRIGSSSDSAISALVRMTR